MNKILSFLFKKKEHKKVHSKFVNQIIKEINNGNTIISLYQSGCFVIFGDCINYPQMKNEDFRNEIITELKEIKEEYNIERYYFSKPDTYDDWTFHLYVKDKK